MSRKKIENRQSAIENRQSPSSWHHRMARLVLDDYAPKCEGRGCDKAVAYACEYDYMRYGKPVSGSKLLCPVHAHKFAHLRRINYLKSAPAVKLSTLEFSNRDNWAYGEDAE
jgi:hypothetical protein